MRNPNRSNFEPVDREADLSIAKDKFRATVLDNDSFFAAITTRLDMGSQIDKAELPDFSCEPTLKYKESGLAIGVRMSSSATDHSTAGLGISFSAFEHLGIGSIDIDSNKAEADPSLTDLLSIAGVEDIEKSVLEILEVWKTGYNDIVREFRGEIAIDPLTNTVELKSTLDSIERIPNE